MRDLTALGLEPNGRWVLPPPTAEQVALVEQMIGGTLPQSYVAFLHYCNGCHPNLRWFGFETEWGASGDLVAAFYSIGSDPASAEDTSEVVWQYRHRGTDVPHGIVPIAMTPFGDKIYLDLTVEGDGRVLLAQHGQPEWASGGSPANTNLVIYVAPSFEVFLDLLTETPDEE